MRLALCLTAIAVMDLAACGGDPEDDGRASSVPGLAGLFAVHDGEKIGRDDRSHAAKQGNLAWHDGKITLFGARNEVIAFQLVVESDASGIQGLSVSLPRLTRRGGGAAIEYAPPGSDPTDYVGRPIQVFVENYLRVAEATRAGWIFAPDGHAAPAQGTGWTPVQLVPENAKPGAGGLPVDVPPSSNQAVWFDVYIPKGLPAGSYQGAVFVRAGGRETRVPVELEVYDFDLPDESSLTAMVYFEPGQVELYQGHDLADRYHRFAHRSRVELVVAYDVAAAEAAASRFDGTDFTAARGYAGPGEALGNRMAPASFFDPGPDYEARATAWQQSDAWMSFLATRLPDVETFLYLPDEPHPADYDHVRRVAANVKSNPGPGRALPLLATSPYVPGLDGAVDIWCAAADDFDPTVASAQRAIGRRYWSYNGRRPQTGAMIIDAPATDPRVNAWAAFKHGSSVYYYWHANMWRHNPQKVGERNQNVWVDPVTFDNRGQPGEPLADQGFANGDGVLVYPGEEVLHPDQDRGVPGPVGSIGLANLRRGIQDHLYLSIARARGLDAAVASALAHVVPRVFTEAGATVGFAERGDTFEEARLALARAIAGAAR